MKKRIIILVSVIIISSLVCLLPITKKIEKDYYSIDTFSHRRAVVSVRLEHFDFLFLKDKVKGEIKVYDGGEIYNYNIDKYFHYMDWPLNEKGDDFVHYLSGFYYNTLKYFGGNPGFESTQPIGFEWVNIYFSPDFENVAVYHEEKDELGEGITRKDVGLEEAISRQYVGNTEKGKETETVNYFAALLKK